MDCGLRWNVGVYENEWYKKRGSGVKHVYIIKTWHDNKILRIRLNTFPNFW